MKGRVILWTVEELEGLSLFLIAMFRLAYRSMALLLPTYIHRFRGMLIGNEEGCFNESAGRLGDSLVGKIYF